MLSASLLQPSSALRTLPSPSEATYAHGNPHQLTYRDEVKETASGKHPITYSFTMSGPPPGPNGPGARSMSVSNGPPSAGMPPPQHMQSQQANVPPPAGASGGSQSQQNLNQIVGPFCSSCLLFALSPIYYPPTATGSLLEPNSTKPSHAGADVSNTSTLNPPLNAHSKGSYAPCKNMESMSKDLEHPYAFTKFENGHPQPPCTYCRNFASRMQLRTSATISP